ncbi:MAG: hypothetical protein MUD01_27835 [Chloroflexaceae bacterium]|jgi:DNA-directed RNA polymerase subunit RPC12/RpoP|nr:hypothetical protein [Chloroflexaceae bacterium]
MQFLVSEVHNFGGFFGGDTVTLSGQRWREAGAEEETLTIDQAALTNIGERHNVSAGMLFVLELAGERVDKATLLAASDHGSLRRALGPALPPAPLPGPTVLSYHCTHCGLWVAGAPDEADGGACCRLCGERIES